MFVTTARMSELCVAAGSTIFLYLLFMDKLLLIDSPKVDKLCRYIDFKGSWAKAICFLPLTPFPS